MLRRTTLGDAEANGPMEPLVLSVKRDIPEPKPGKHWQAVVPQARVLEVLADAGAMAELREVYEKCVIRSNKT